MAIILILENLDRSGLRWVEAMSHKKAETAYIHHIDAHKGILLISSVYKEEDAIQKPWPLEVAWQSYLRLMPRDPALGVKRMEAAIVDFVQNDNTKAYVYFLPLVMLAFWLRGVVAHSVSGSRLHHISFLCSAHHVPLPLKCDGHAGFPHAPNIYSFPQGRRCSSHLAIGMQNNTLTMTIFQGRLGNDARICKLLGGAK